MSTSRTSRRRRQSMWRNWPQRGSDGWLSIYEYSICMYVYVCRCMYACMSVCMHVCVYVCMYTYIHTYIYIYIYVYVCAYTGVFAHEYAYLCVCMYIYTYIYIYIFGLLFYFCVVTQVCRVYRNSTLKKHMCTSFTIAHVQAYSETGEHINPVAGLNKRRS